MYISSSPRSLSAGVSHSPCIDLFAASGCSHRCEPCIQHCVSGPDVFAVMHSPVALHAAPSHIYFPTHRHVPVSLLPVNRDMLCVQSAAPGVLPDVEPNVLLSLLGAS